MLHSKRLTGKRLPDIVTANTEDMHKDMRKAHTIRVQRIEALLRVLTPRYGNGSIKLTKITRAL